MRKVVKRYTWNDACMQKSKLFKNVYTEFVTLRKMLSDITFAFCNTVITHGVILIELLVSHSIHKLLIII